MKRLILSASVLLLIGVARDASAQTFIINPFLGTTLSSPSEVGSHSKPGFGIALGSIKGILGAEMEFAYYPEILDNEANALAKNKVLTFSGNTIIGPMIGGHVKPYGAFGFGDLFLNVTKLSDVVVPNPESISKNYFTFNVGGGVMGFFNKHLGVRGDLRYYRAFGFNLTDVESTGLALDRFNFWRLNIGFVARF